MAGYLGTKAVLLSTTAADVVGNAEIGGSLTVGGNVDFGGGDLRFDTSANIYGKADNTGFVSLFGGGSYNSGAGIGVAGSGNASANSIIFTRGAYQESMRIDASGRVGIGVVPESWYAGFSTQALQLGGTTSLWALSNGSTDLRTTLDNNLYISTSGNNTYLNDGPASRYQQSNGQHRWYVAASGTADTTATIDEAMRIDSSGRVMIGTTSGTGTGVGGATFYPTSYDRDILALGSNTTLEGAELLWFYNPNGKVGRIETNANSTSYVTTSDYRLKTDAQPITGASARVQALNPVNFEWLSDGTRVDGFLAHEAQEVVPEAVSGTKDAMRDEQYEVTPAVYEDVIIPAVLDEEGNELEAERTEQRLVSEAVMGTRSVPDYQGIDQSKLVPLLTAALQEALTEIADLKARVTALEAV